MRWSDYAVAGVAELPPKRTSSGTTTLELIGRVSAMAAHDAGIAPADIDGLIVGPHVGETPQHVPATVAEYLGLRPTFADIVDLGGATGTGMVWRAAAAIAAGQAETVLCVLANTRDPERSLRSPNRNPIREFEVPYGASGANQAYAMVAQRYLADHGATAEDLALVAVRARENAQRNRDAVFYGRPITVEDVLESPVVASPLHLLEVVMPCAGGAAVIVTTAERAARDPRASVALQGAGEYITHRALSHAESFDRSPLATAIARASEQAGFGAADAQVLSLYDCYSIVVLVTLEDAGLCERGTAAEWLRRNDTSPEGNVTLNPHGGQLGCGQSDLAGGMGHIVEAVRQLRGDAVGRQMQGARRALVTGNGATLSEAVALMLERRG
ncbi:thiolase family protein [Ruicaihuangia caeni]|uniref:Thiolase family protein n=1 Tax=Ruicaihuangia caeni TaxID=3042517 RepID=A0AAW6T232_9MICO|nr:thiolase family protein [Klugiella sp. YN-L-19]MDI2097389.1 thiolase family protein [Klugiella sp. YN-L-19]